MPITHTNNQVSSLHQLDFESLKPSRVVLPIRIHCDSKRKSQFYGLKKTCLQRGVVPLITRMGYNYCPCLRRQVCCLISRPIIGNYGQSIMLNSSDNGGDRFSLVVSGNDGSKNS